MRIRLRTTAMLAILATCSAFVFAQAPGRVGRISLTQGQVNIGGEPGEQVDRAVVNWPVTSRNQITTGRDSRTEIRIGSTAVRLDADSALDVTELDDETLRLHLHYGSAIVRVRNVESLRGFELSTPQGIVRMQDVGRMRVDAGRRRDTTVVSVFDGVALIDGGGARLTVRAGKRAEMGSDDIRTGLAVRDGFDEWAMLRDARDDRSESVRYVGREMTGYEDLDQYGSWRDDAQYGPLWSPRQVSAGWVPYRDGRWTYLQPWGWTWVDNAPWGYAPFHYGRWVTVSNRWYWAPGRNVSRAIWSPALVGWVGGDNWHVPFSGTRRPTPARGWYPLAPRDAYVPTYRTSHEHLRDVNRYAGTPGQDVKRRYGPAGNNRQGLTVVPQEQFNQRGSIAVRNTPQPVVSPSVLAGAPMFMPPALEMMQRERLNDSRNDNRNDGRGRVERGAGAAMGSAVSQAVEAANRANQVPVISNAQLPAAPADGRRDGRLRNDEQRRQRMDKQAAAPANDNSVIARAQAQAEAAAQGQAAEQVRQQQAQQMQAQQMQAQQAQLQQMQAQQEQMRARAQFQAEARAEVDRERRRAPESFQQRQQPRQEAPAPVGFAQPTQERAMAPISPPPQRQESERNEQREERRQLRQEIEDKR